MVDLETLSTRSNAVILVIAGIKFDRQRVETLDEPVETMDTFYRRVHIQSCVDVGMHIDPETEAWWKTQSTEMYEENFGKERVPLQTALEDFKKWYGKSTLVWSNGASFDIPILDEAYLRCNQKSPWKYWEIRDTRTIYDIGNVKSYNLPKINNHHALYDCWRQIWGVKKAIQYLRQTLQPPHLLRQTR